MADLSPVQEYYKDKTVFITGASGFMGKVLLEKLLYSCHSLKEVIIICRPKRGKTPEARLEDMFKLPIFQRIKDERPHMLKKVTIYQGDVTYDLLGLSGDSLKHVVENTNIVFHMAATLKLEGNLRDAIDMNLLGTKRALNVAKDMKQLEAFVHLSTAFCNCDQEVMYEKVYEFPHKPEDLMRLAEWMDVKTLDAITPDLLKPHPNTYTYSKRLAELLVRDHYETMPVIIARPSIVTPAAAEPLPGWVDNMNGPTGVLIGAGKGVIRSMICNGELRSEVIPVDIAINGLILLPYHNSRLKQKPQQIPVYNLTVDDAKKRSWKWIMDVGRDLGLKYPFDVGLWYPDGNMTTSKFYHTICTILFMWLPAYIIDFLLAIFGQRRFMVRVQTKISVGLEVLQFFTTRNWDFKSTHFEQIYKEISEEDRKIFKINTNDVDDYEYMKISILGGRQYVMKEPLTSLPKARIQLRFMYVLDRISKGLILGGFIYWASMRLGLIDLVRHGIEAVKH
ncbi:putative fatty acyl-CoA reductase CG5065 isoform X1 [Drosophila novamexicana]|uniref:putative fatty acyl-CoA reductase CG5065 isoform X1 n=2 Tax=virilis group TaxID=32335 RepID=UPI0011E6048F|nr:putative fatty acyl-CoA reductase CG5065 isoform X1 [Drosophila novamexicana]XP_030557713.1 putative fatty acyl-CoA reductase CG5065 isoform X1 [Drosophila novamexicana]